jgi:hypothetical protein
MPLEVRNFIKYNSEFAKPRMRIIATVTGKVFGDLPCPTLLTLEVRSFQLFLLVENKNVA